MRPHTEPRRLSPPARGLGFALPPATLWWIGVAVAWPKGWLLVTLWAALIGPAIAVAIVVAEASVVDIVG